MQNGAASFPLSPFHFNKLSSQNVCLAKKLEFKVNAFDLPLELSEFGVWPQLGVMVNAKSQRWQNKRLITGTPSWWQLSTLSCEMMGSQLAFLSTHSHKLRFQSFFHTHWCFVAIKNNIGNNTRESGMIIQQQVEQSLCMGSTRAESLAPHGVP